jgi:hypothetical protein
MKAALPRCARCRAPIHAIDLGAERCWDRQNAELCLWRRALAKWRLPRAREVVARIEARRRGDG